MLYCFIDCEDGALVSEITHMKMHNMPSGPAMQNLHMTMNDGTFSALRHKQSKSTRASDTFVIETRLQRWDTEYTEYTL